MGSYLSCLRENVPLASSGFAETLLRMREEGQEEGGAAKWNREACPDIDPKKDSIMFLPSAIQDIDGPAVQVFGSTTETGNSVLLTIDGFLPHMHVPAPNGFKPGDVILLKEYLNTVATRTSPVQSVDFIEGEEPCLKIVATDAKALKKVQGVFSKGKCKFRALFPQAIEPFDVKTTLGDMFSPDAAVELRPKMYSLVPEEKRQSRCQIEVTSSVQKLRIETDPSEPGLRILSFDIECPGLVGTFPRAEFDPIVQISNMVIQNGESTPFIRNIFTLKSCDPMPGAQVLSFNYEEELLRAWREFVLTVDPDLVTGYNMSTFDVRYILGRVKALGMNLEEFRSLGRMKHTYPSSSTLDVWHGRLVLDVLPFIRKYYDLPSNKLGNVSAYFLGEKKELDDYNLLRRLQNGNSKTRKVLALYCLKDSYLPLRLMDELRCIDICLQESKATGLAFNDLLRVSRRKTHTETPAAESG